MGVESYRQVENTPTAYSDDAFIRRHIGCIPSVPYARSRPLGNYLRDHLRQIIQHQYSLCVNNVYMDSADEINSMYSDIIDCFYPYNGLIYKVFVFYVTINSIFLTFFNTCKIIIFFSFSHIPKFCE